MFLKDINKNKKLIACVILAVLPIVVVIVLVFRGVHDRNQYKEFLSDLDTSISFALKKSSLRAEIYGSSTQLAAKNADSIFMMILDGGYYYYDEEMPETEKVLLLDFGTGEELWLYAQDADADLSSLIVRYIAIDDTEYTCMTMLEYRFSNIEKLVSVDFGNTLWKEPAQ